MNDLDLVLRFAVALGLGFLLGLERERSGDPEERWAGVRTFALIALLGATTGFLSDDLTLLAAFVFLGFAALVVASYVRSSRDQDHLGTTTEVTALLTFLVGLLAGLGHLGLASMLSVAALLLLALKDALHRFAHRVESAEVEAMLKFALITVIILPLIPNRTFGPEPYDVINPFRIWLMVVLIAGLNFVGYVLAKMMGADRGFALTGIVGGLVSSTATTLGFSQHSRRDSRITSQLLMGILLAWAVMFVRVIVLVAVVAPQLLRHLVVTLGAMAVATLIVVLVVWRRGHKTRARHRLADGNPLELGKAIKFGLLFAAVTILARVAQVHFGESGLYLAAAVSGATDVDAISLSMANLARESSEMAAAAARAIVIAVLANTLVKTGIVAVTGAESLRRPMFIVTPLILVVGLAAMMLA